MYTYVHLLYESTNEDTTLYYNVVVLPEILSYESTKVRKYENTKLTEVSYESMILPKVFYSTAHVCVFCT